MVSPCSWADLTNPMSFRQVWEEVPGELLWLWGQGCCGLFLHPSLNPAAVPSAGLSSASSSGGWVPSDREEHVCGFGGKGGEKSE